MAGQDLVTLVNTQDEVVGDLDKNLGHYHDAPLHRAISVFLLRRNLTGKTELLLQQRSSQKITGAGFFANTVCGNVWPNEDYLACAYRRLDKELNLGQADLTTELKPLYHFLYAVYVNEDYGEHELDQIFLGGFREIVAPNPDEVTQIVAVDVEALLAEFDKRMSLLPTVQKKFLTHPQDYCNLGTKQLKNLTPFLQLKLNFSQSDKNKAPQQITLAPWTAIILANPRLRQALREFFH